MKIEEFKEQLKILTAAFDEPMSSERAQVYYNMFKKRTIEQFKEGVQNALKHLKCFPSISELLEVTPKNHFSMSLNQRDDGKLRNDAGQTYDEWKAAQ